MKSCKDMDDNNQRKFSRVKIQGAVRLAFSSKQYSGVLDNLSLCGAFVKGTFKQSTGDICIINFKEAVFESEIAVRVIGSVAWNNDSGIAIDFIAMRTESYHWLETELLTQAVDPSTLEDEILQQNFFKLDEDLVYNSTFSYNKNKLKKLLDLP
ncbi:MAG: PilZ domain-containing protein [Candidatus Electrothrix sp. ATG2]|nr:PilZ domain-containing protein [Candidatus Electrothrix sp. ATG2]